MGFQICISILKILFIVLSIQMNVHNVEYKFKKMVDVNIWLVKHVNFNFVGNVKSNGKVIKVMNVLNIYF